MIDVIDNGIGLPKVARQRLLEPYVTTRAKGTGLGLAIVGRVLEDHGGRIELKDAADFRAGQRGAWMRLRFAVSGHAAKVEVQKTGTQRTDSKEQAGSNPTASGTNVTGEAKPQPAGQTSDMAQTTNNDNKTEDTRTEAATGN